MAFAESTGQERTEQPTAKRREDARRKGQVAKSADLTTACLLLGALGIYSLAGGQLVAHSVEAFRRGLEAVPRADLTPTAALALFFDTAATIARLAWPFLVVPLAAAAAAQLVQTRLAVSWEALGFKWSRLSPAQGLARLLSGRSLVETLKTAIKVAVLGGIVYATLRVDWPALLLLGQAGPEATLGTVATVIRHLWLAVGLSYLLLAGLDYGQQWWHHQRSLRMTREEVREESKEVEGNPLLRSRVRALQRQRAARRMMAEVKRADVVLRNPTHVAVALRYESGRMRAPKVVAKGARLVAQRIVEAARRHGVPVVENPPLARSLFRIVAVGHEIPRELYRTVAEVLAYVYALKGRGQ